MSIVVIDSNALIADYRLRSVAMTGLVERFRANKLRLVVPEVVVREVIAHFGRDLTEAAATMTKAAGTLGRLGLDAPAHTLNPREGAAEYEQWLRGQLQELGASIPEPPEVQHLDLVDRALQGRAPFSDDGRKGYRDALIWETVLSCARAGTVAFVTNNHRDFAESTDDVSLVAPTLRADLMRIDEPHDQVLVCRTPDAVIKHLFLPDEQLLAALREPGAIDPADLIALMDPVLPIDQHPDLGLPDAAHLIGVTDLEPIERDEAGDPDIDVLSALHWGAQTAYVQLRVPAHGDIAFSVVPDEVDDRPGAVRTFDLEPGATEETRFGTASRDLVVTGIASYDVARRRFNAFTATKTAPRSRTVVPRNAHLLQLAPGDLVTHPTFGDGLVERITGEGSGAEAEIRFFDAGTRHLLLAYAPVSRDKAARGEGDGST